MAHNFVEKAELILDKEFKVLDKGFIRLVDYYGSDARIVQAARVSYGKGTKTLREDKQLINYLWMNEHTSPFEQVIFTFHCKLPIFVARQWIRHRTARVNEISARYSVMKNEFYIPSEENIKYQSKNNKQGRADEVINKQLKEKVLDIFIQTNSISADSYKELIESNIARELARISLPLSLYTEWYWQIDLKNLLHFLKLRMDKHAQFEIREYANEISKIVEIVCPLTYQAFKDYTLNSIKLSFEEINMLRNIYLNKEVDKESSTYKLLKDKIDFI
jgi:thymidylate synthase (FAD)